MSGAVPNSLLHLVVPKKSSAEQLAASRGSKKKSSAEQVAASRGSNVLATSTPTNASRDSNSDKRSSAEQPAASRGSNVPPRPGIILKEATPLSDKLLRDLEDTEDSAALIHYMKEHCFFGELRFVTSPGYRAPQAMPFSSKMENLLQIALAQRRKIAEAAGLTNKQLLEHRATPSQMQDMMNTWRKDVTEWMSTDNQEKYFGLLDAKQNQKAHQLSKRCFSTCCFQISGCMFLLRKLIQLPVISTENRNASTALRQLLQDFKDYQKSAKYKAAMIPPEQRKCCTA